MILRFPALTDFSKRPKLSRWQLFKLWLAQPPKAKVLKIKNPAHWKLERVRRAARRTI